jgi:hypothetical protein
VVVTPRVSSDAEFTDRRRWEILRENIRRFGAGEPLEKVVDKRVGYGTGPLVSTPPGVSARGGGR